MSDQPSAPSSTQLAIERTRLANERTLMAWTRTATSLISFGFTIYKFFAHLREQNANSDHDAFGPRPFGMLLIATGLIALVLATISHHRSMAALRRYDSTMPRSLAEIVAVLVALLGLIGMLVLSFRL